MKPYAYNLLQNALSFDFVWTDALLWTKTYGRQVIKALNNITIGWYSELLFVTHFLSSSSRQEVGEISGATGKARDFSIIIICDL